MATLPGTTGRRRLYLMRHGFVDYTSKTVVESQDPSLAYLTPSGRDEARAAGLALKDIHFDLALSSGLRRTRETAEIVLSEHPYDLELEDEPRFAELRSGRYIDFESAEQLAATMTFQFEKAGEPGATFLEGGEAFADALERVATGVRALLARPAWHTALLVAHEGINRILLSWAIGAPLGTSACFEQDTGCINIIDFDLVPSGRGEGAEIERSLIKAVNLTPANYLKNGMNLRSLESIFTRAREENAGT
ncbi:MAG: histidine phosphatase family protein [Pseudomonadota bacterium]